MVGDEPTQDRPGARGNVEGRPGAGTTPFGRVHPQAKSPVHAIISGEWPVNG